jgi:RNA polymerase sigma-70 factor (ECF subfamily)
VKDTCIAENIIQDIFVSLWKNRHEIDFGVHFKTYLFNATRNRAINYLKIIKRKESYKIVSTEIEFDPDTPETLLHTEEMHYAIQAAIDELPSKCKEIFCMNRFDNLTYNEIATILEISIKTVETQISRALKHLRKRLAFYFNN